MSIIYNNQIVAGKYKEQIINKADTINAGIIKISTQEEVDSGIDNTTAITPLYLSQKQDKLVAGDNIIMDENLIECNIYPDEQTIIQNDDGTFTNIGQLTKSGTIKIDWEGTEAEYTQAMLDGIIQPDWYCYITDDESIIDYADVANQRLSNLRPEGEKHFLNKSQISNCLLEIPQNIKVEIANGQIILKTGSKVVTPNGVDIFDEKVTTKDYTSAISSGNGQYVVFYRQSVDDLRLTLQKTNYVSGATVPTNIPSLCWWYDTANNIIKVTTDTGATWKTQGDSLPICIATVTNGVVTSIDQVFNGFGYIGSTIWVDKGVKGLIPDGRNEDGSLKNIEFVTQRVLTNTNSNTNNYVIALNSTTFVDTRIQAYDEEKNIVYNTNTGAKTSFCLVGTMARNTGIVYNFNPKLPFRAIDYNNLKEKTNYLEQNSLNKSQITNCITEIPQRIKYTLENGVLTVKAGSVAIVPYGNLDRTFYKVGNVTFNEDTLQASNFSETNYIQTHERFILGNSWEIVTKFTTGNDITTNQNILWCGDGMALNIANSKLGLYLGNGDGWNLAKAQAGTTTLTVNTTYYAKVSYNGSSYTMSLSTNGTNWNTEYTLANTNIVKSGALFQFGFYSGAIYFRGSIDISKTSVTINGVKCFNPEERLTTKYPVGSIFLNNNFKVYDTQYIPPQTPTVNGTDGRFFVWVEAQNDINLTGAGQATGQCPLMLSITNNSLAFNDLSVTGSGADYTTDTTYYTYYDTTLNIVYKRSNASTDWFSDVWAFPLVTFTRNAGTISSVDQVFNGFGYVGSAVWSDKGVKFLISNGRNNDETLKNIEYTTENFYIAQNTGSYTSKHYLTFTLDHIVGGKYYPIVWDASYYVQVDKPSRTSCIWRNPITNYMYSLRTGFEGGIIQSKAVVFGGLTFTNGKVTSFNTKQPFRAVDEYDFEASINNLETNIDAVVPTGAIISSASSTSPTGYLLCNGSAISRTTYAKLFNAIGTTYGEGDGSTTFNLPNYSNYNFVTSATVGIKGTGKALGLTDGKTNIGTRAYASTTAIYGYKSSYNANVGTNSSTSGGVIDGATLGVVQNTSTSGLTGTATTKKLNWYIKY